MAPACSCSQSFIRDFLLAIIAVLATSHQCAFAMEGIHCQLASIFKVNNHVDRMTHANIAPRGNVRMLTEPSLWLRMVPALSSLYFHWLCRWRHANMAMLVSYTRENPSPATQLIIMSLETGLF
jgi:hypothetical protein